MYDRRPPADVVGGRGARVCLSFLRTNHGDGTEDRAERNRLDPTPGRTGGGGNRQKAHPCCGETGNRVAAINRPGRATKSNESSEASSKRNETNAASESTGLFHQSKPSAMDPESAMHGVCPGASPWVGVPSAEGVLRFLLAVSVAVFLGTAFLLQATLLELGMLRCRRALAGWRAVLRGGLSVGAVCLAGVSALCREEAQRQPEDHQGGPSDRHHHDGPAGHQTGGFLWCVLGVGLGGDDLPPLVDHRRNRVLAAAAGVRLVRSEIGVCFLQKARKLLVVIALVGVLPPHLLQSFGPLASLFVKPVVGGILEIVVLVVFFGCSRPTERRDHAMHKATTGPDRLTRPELWAFEDLRLDVFRAPVGARLEDLGQHAFGRYALLFGRVEECRVVARAPVTELSTPVQRVHVAVRIVREDLVACFFRVVFHENNLVVPRVVPVGCATRKKTKRKKQRTFGRSGDEIDTN
ncbi:unnamed protein product [Pseudo-nitzschia multistriata]|uniref:Uncharacterized protein n=1 Tax=Pseudo-nitzschia multistriata TaxID=183589 RepID=A0A448ZKX0_9STRA|nr:unnamed protein product [Pseudo-nitzschia multistriata]